MWAAGGGGGRGAVPAPGGLLLCGQQFARGGRDAVPAPGGHLPCGQQVVGVGVARCLLPEVTCRLGDS